jgi:hypothetical protein
MEVFHVCVEHERWTAAATCREHDLEEIRLLFDRYRRAVEVARACEHERFAPSPAVEADAEREPERVPAGVGA